MGVEDVIGQQAVHAAGMIVANFEAMAATIVGVSAAELAALGGDVATVLDTFFSNILAFLGNLDPLNELFKIETAAENFVHSRLLGTQHFFDLLGLLGHPLGLGTGNPILPIDPTKIPVLGPIIGDVEQSASNWETLLTGTGKTIEELASELASGIASGVAAIDQALRDAVAHALGHFGGEPYSDLDVKAFLEEIPMEVIRGILSTSVTLVDDVTAFAKALWGDIIPLSKILNTAIQNFLTGHTSLADDLTALSNALWGGPTALSKILSSGIANILAGGADLGADMATIANALWGSTTPLGKILSSGIANILAGGADLGADMATIANALWGSTTPLGKILAAGIQNLFGGTDLGNELRQLLGGSYPKTFPFVFGFSPAGALAGAKADLAKFQQLIDGIAGTVGGDVKDAVNAFHSGLAEAKSFISQAILDGINGTNFFTGIAQALQNIPAENIIGAVLSAIDQDLRDIIANALGHPGSGFILSQVEAFLKTIPPPNIVSFLTGNTTLADDMASLSNALWGSNTPLGKILSSGIANILAGGADLGADLSTIANALWGGITPLATILNTAIASFFTGHTTLADDLTALSNALWGGPTVLAKILAGGVSNILAGGASLGADMATIANALWGSTTPLGKILANGIQNLFGGASLGAELRQLLGGSFPKTFPFVFGQSPTGALAGAKADLAKLQQLIDGIAGTVGGDVKDAVNAFHSGLAEAKSEISQAILDGISGSNFFTGIAQALQNIPVENIIGAALAAIDQELRDAIANALGHLGSGFIPSQIEAFLKSIPTINIVALLSGNTTLADDMSALANALWGSTTPLGKILSSGIANILAGGADLGADMSTVANALWGSTTPLGKILASGIANILAGGANLGADMSTVANALWGSTTPLAKILNTAISNILVGGASLGADMGTIANALWGSTTPLAKILNTAIGAVFGGASLGAEFHALLGGSYPKTFPFTFGQSPTGAVAVAKADLAKFQQLVDGFAGTVGGDVSAAVKAFHSGLAEAKNEISQAILDGINGTNVFTGIAQALQNVPYSNIVSFLTGHANLGQDINALSNAIWGGPSPLSYVLNSKVASLLSGSTTLADDITTFGKALWGSTGLVPASKILSSAVANLLTGNTTLADDMASLSNALWGGQTPLSYVLNSKIQNLLSGNTTLAGDLASLSNALWGGQTPLSYVLNSKVASLLSGSTTLADDITTFGKALWGGTGLIPATKILLANIASFLTGHTTLADDITSIANALWGGPTALAKILASSIGSVLGGTSLGGDIAQNLAASFPKTFPFIFGTTTATNPLHLVSYSDWQQLLDGMAGKAGSTVNAAVNGFHSKLATVKSDLSQDLINGLSPTVNAITGAGQAFEGFANNLFGGANPLSAPIQYPALPQINVGGAVTDIGSHVQTLVDSVIGSLGGASGGNAPSLLGQWMAKIPHGNIIIPGSPAIGLGGITWDSSQTTSTTGSSSSLGTSWLHTIGSTTYTPAPPASPVTYTANFLTVKITFQSGAANPGNLASNVTYAGVNMTLLQAVNQGQLYTQIWGLGNPPSGINTVSATAWVTTGLNTVTILVCESDSYYDVREVGSIITNAGTSGSPNIANMASGAVDWVVQTIAALGNSSLGTFVGYSSSPAANTGAPRGNTNTINGASSITLLASDSTGIGGSVTFAVTASAFISEWIAIGVNLVPIPTGAIGSGFLQYRSLTATYNTSTGDQLLPSSFFDINQYNTPDLSYLSATHNQLTVNNAGWYAIKISVYLDASAGVNQLGVILYQNGAITQRGTPHLDFSGRSYTGPVGDTFFTYCDVGDTLQPGISTSTGYVLFGESTGTYCYWSVTLCNRSLL
jgi:hypothetical protein